MNLEVKEDSTFTFSFTKLVDGLASNISTATIVLLSNTGETQLSSTAMTINNNVATYANDFSGTPENGEWAVKKQNYQAIMTIDGVEYVRLFDIVRYPFINEVTGNDLLSENRGYLEGKGFRIKGRSDSGTVNTLVDTRLIGADDLTGGQLEVYTNSASEQGYVGKITDHNTTTGTLTFTPDRETAVSTNEYNATSSWDSDIQSAGEIVRESLWKQDRRPYLIIDNTQVSRLIIYKFFERLSAKCRRAISDEDVDHINYMYYSDLYQREMAGMSLRYDENDDGKISSTEEKTRKWTVDVRR